ncbi:alpha/beta fold hydrolase [Rhizorhapis sp. SPR117]|uniref:alpha/beta fold hydrolase n=1 Tax=Rhizorhapis sp. SPR117 TaxID=2912611 RepID=UPI001F47FBDD|nr:alpha/beta hydrolase [Rhizorhapis sp. SPR117]
MISIQTVTRTYPPGSKITYWNTPDSWPLRRFDWSVPAGSDSAGAERGSLLFLTGRGDCFEKYLEVFAHFHEAGWNITSFDWRGQGGSGRLSDNPHVGHVESFDIWIADLANFYRQWSAGHPGPGVIVGHSMGGHILLRAISEKTIDPGGAALVAPMLGMNSGIVPSAVGAWIARVMCMIGDAARPAWKNTEKPGVGASLRQSLLTHSRERYDDELFWKKEKPELQLGPPSWKWMREAYKSLVMLHAPGTLEAVGTPLLMLGVERDGLVDPCAIRRVARRIVGCRVHMYGPESAHEILREVDPVRLDALARIDAFFDEVAPRR